MAKQETVQLLREQQLAEVLNVPLKTVQAWRFHGRGPGHIKLIPGRSGSVRYHPREVERWLAAQSTGGGAVLA
jgi:hypothetical protein